MTITSVLLFVLGIALLVFGGDRLVRGASALAFSIGISPLVVGLTVVAFGTSAPELAVSLNGALQGSADLAVGNVVGSNIFNVLAILGLAALVTPLAVQPSLIRLEIPLLVLVSASVVAFGWNGVINRAEGVALVIGVVVYTAWVIVQSRKQTKALKEEFKAEFEPEKSERWYVSTLSIVAGLGLLILGSHWVVGGAIELARFLGASELVISLTIVAAGTSLPEVVTSVSAAMKGERDIAVGNVIGSNLFNILCVLGLSAVITPEGIHVATEAMSFDIPVMVAVSVLIVPVFLSGWIVDRMEGAVLMALYFGYTAVLVITSSDVSSHEAFRSAYIWGMWPLALMIMVLLLWRSKRKESLV
jgi:cation:H+ antiporter